MLTTSPLPYAADRRLPVGTLRGIQRLSSDAGILSLCALDHRGALRLLIDPAHLDAVSDETVVAHKGELCAALAPHVSAVLLDPSSGAEHAVVADALPHDVGLVVSAADDCAADEDGARVSELLVGWGAADARRLGADGASLVAYYHPGHSESAAWQLRVVQRFVERCREGALPSLVQAFTYRLDPETPESFTRRRAELVIEAARQMTALGVDLLATGFPGDVRATRDDEQLRDACRELDAASRVPWVLCGAGVTFDEFARQLRLACEAGAAGFLAGRILWEEAIAIADVGARRHWLRTVAADRLRRLVDIAGANGRPWWAGRTAP